jgi:hypothetical protein
VFMDTEPFGNILAGKALCTSNTIRHRSESERDALCRRT